MDEPRSNPFTESRATVLTSCSLLTYGDDSLTFFSRLQNGNRRLSQSQISYGSQKQTEEWIFKKYEKSLYTMDQQGHCLAENALDDLITQDSDQKQDFWSKIKAFKPTKQIQNPFFSGGSSTTEVKAETTTKKLAMTRKAKPFQQLNTIKTKRQSTRLQMIKIKDILKKQRQKQVNRESKEQKFSLVNMYKNKRQNSQALNTAVTFGHTNRQFIIEVEEKQALPPAILTLKGIEYFRIPLSD